MLSEGNVKRLVAKLTKMRGAALKLGQFMSIQGALPVYFTFIWRLTSIYLPQDSHLLPEQLEGILQKVPASAHYMPTWQMEVSCHYTNPSTRR